MSLPVWSFIYKGELCRAAKVFVGLSDGVHECGKCVCICLCVCRNCMTDAAQCNWISEGVCGAVCLNSSLYEVV